MFLIQWVLLICAYYMPLVWEIYQEFAPKVLGYLVQVFFEITTFRQGTDDWHIITGPIGRRSL